MLILQQKRHGINFYKVWFAKQPIKEAGIVTYYEYMGEKPEVDCVEFDTLITDLTEDEDVIKQHFSKSCKYNINRAMREDVVIHILQPSEIKGQDLTQFCDFFEAFWGSKGSDLKNKQRLMQELSEYNEQGALTISYAEVNGEVAVYHTHISDGQIARSWHSASLYRLQEDEEGSAKKLIGMANRLLHFEDMKHFKKIGFTTYDWGGAGHAEDVIHITEFKESFGGTPVVYYNFEQTNGIMAKLFKVLVRILGK